MSSEVPDDEIDVVIHQSEVGVVEMARRFENSDGVDSEQY